MLQPFHCAHPALGRRSRGVGRSGPIPEGPFRSGAWPCRFTLFSLWHAITEAYVMPCCTLMHMFRDSI